MKISELGLDPNADVTDELVLDLISKMSEDGVLDEQTIADVKRIAEDPSLSDDDKEDKIVEYAVSKYKGDVPTDPEEIEKFLDSPEWGAHVGKFLDILHPDEEVEIEMDGDGDGDIDASAVDVNGDGEIDAASVHDDGDDDEKDSTGKREAEDNANDDTVEPDEDVSDKTQKRPIGSSIRDARVKSHADNWGQTGTQKNIAQNGGKNPKAAAPKPKTTKVSDETKKDAKECVSDERMKNIESYADNSNVANALAGLL